MATPNIKLEHSPANSLADSFVSTPGTTYPSLFSETMDPTEVMTPTSFDDDSNFGSCMGDLEILETLAPEKKPVKKRKSWGQQLPEPKTNLPPRKRAKTDDEKEQRRVERVLRNRRAAQSSRERKRQEVEALEAEKRSIERKNSDLELRLADMEAKNLILQRQLEQFTGTMTVFGSSQTASIAGQTEQFRQSSSPVTFSQELFSSRDALERPATQLTTEPLPSLRTVNPASLSPEIRPVAESSNASSSDMTQHPAAMLCDLQCQSVEQRPWKSSIATFQLWVITSWISLASAATSTLLSPLSQIITSLKTGSSLSPTPSILTMIIWLATTTASLTTSTSMNSSTMTTSHNQRPRFSLRIPLLRRLLACSPHLARPLMDATMVAMRSASEQQLVHDCTDSADACDRHGARSSPSVEALMTLLWVTHVFEEDKKRQQTAPELDTAAARISQACGELDDLFRPTKIDNGGEGRMYFF